MHHGNILTYAPVSLSTQVKAPLIGSINFSTIKLLEPKDDNLPRKWGTIYGTLWRIKILPFKISSFYFFVSLFSILYVN